MFLIFQHQLSRRSVVHLFTNSLKVRSTPYSKFIAGRAMSKRKIDSFDGIKAKKQKKNQPLLKFEGTHDEVLREDVRKLLVSRNGAAETEDGLGVGKSQNEKLPKKFDEIEVQISGISSTGDGIGLSSEGDHAYIVPFTAPGDLVKAKVIRTHFNDNYTITDFLRVLKPSSRRDDSLIKCPYFAKCSGCQFQMLPYEDQLAHKKAIVEKAYRNFSGLSSDVVPSIGDTIASPLQYGYRTKLTPHFDGPPGMRRKRGEGPKPTFTKVPPIGFMQKNTRWTIDIEDCPIGTDAVRAGIKSERERVSKELDRYGKGATLLLRESTEREPQTGNELSTAAIVETKKCVTDPNAFSTEFIDSYKFVNPAGSFFQNNNSILPVFTQYIRDQITKANEPPLTHLIDAYCGSGLFTVTLASLFKSSIGVDIAGASIACAEKNAKLNNTKNTRFIAATASKLFESVNSPPDETLVVIDPPRKGCDEDFLTQLLNFGPKKVIYVSCNVHTQARDVGIMVKGIDGCKANYSIESLRGFDFFPQTGHVEGVAVLNRIT
jgi:tRNA (uracil-5-)-methyltransferase